MNTVKSAEPVSAPSVLRSAGAMGIATFFSRILGLVREQVFAVLFGAGAATDAFNIAFRIPNLLRDLFAEGAMSSALVPTFSKVRHDHGDARAWRVAGLVFRVLFVMVSVLSIVGIIFAPELVGFYASAFRDTPGKFELTVLLTRIMFPFFPLVALAAAYMAILNACGKFFMPSFASALFNVASIVSGVSFVFWFRAQGGEPIVGMAIGVVIGGGVQAFCQLPLIYRQGYRWIPRLPNSGDFLVWHQDPALRRILALMLPGMVGLAATQINILVNSVLATSQGEGAVSWLNYANRLMLFPIGIFGVSLATATLSRVSRLWAAGETAESSRTLDQSVRQVIAINLPAAAGLAFLGVPIVQLLFEYGRFDQSDTLATAQALMAYSVGLVAYSGVKVLVPVCYALGASRIAVISSVLSVALTIVLNLLTVQSLGYVGLALGTSLAAFFNFAFLAWAVHRIFREKPTIPGGLPLGGWLRTAVTHLLIALVMGGLCALTHRELSALFSETDWRAWGGPFAVILLRGGLLGVVMLEALAILLIVYRLFRIQEGEAVTRIFYDRLRKKLRR